MATKVTETAGEQEAPRAIPMSFLHRTPMNARIVARRIQLRFSLTGLALKKGNQLAKEIDPLLVESNQIDIESETRYCEAQHKVILADVRQKLEEKRRTMHQTDFEALV